MKLSIEGERDGQSVTPDWQVLTTSEIAGVTAHEVKPVVTGNGVLVEVLRAEWLGERNTVGHVFLRTIDPRGVSAWHVHHTTTDRLSCIAGRARIVLFDARPDSPTHGTVAEHLVAAVRPTLLVVPPGVFHGVQAMGAEPATIVNMADEAYSYELPDHWRLPANTMKIPYEFS